MPIFSLKGFLTLVAVGFAGAGVVLIIFLASASTVGKTPFTAISLVSEVNSGVLGPGEQRWFKFRPGSPGDVEVLERAFTLTVMPGESSRVARVTLRVFEENQLAFFSEGDTSRMTDLGTGQVAAQDAQLITGKFLWQGRLAGGRFYYIELTNGNEVPLNYWLLPGATSAGQLSYNSLPNAAPGAAPQSALPLQWSQNRGRLEPGQEIWYSFVAVEVKENGLVPMALTMITTPDDGNRIQRMHFNLFTAGAVQGWSPGGNTAIPNFGAGSVVVRDNNPWTGERVWAGWLIKDGRYYVQVRNDTDIHMDYWLFTGDVYGPELGE